MTFAHNARNLVSDGDTVTTGTPLAIAGKTGNAEGEHMLLTPVVLTWYIATELGSILENAAEMGAPVPPVLREVLEKVHKASDRKDMTASAGHQDE